MSNPAEPQTNDPIALQAMLAAERAENERLRQIIKELQRHRFGRRAESLPVDQLLLGLEEAEQVEAEGFAAEDTPDPAKREARASKRRTNRGALPAHLPRIEQVIDIPDKICPCCKGMLHVTGEDRSERLDIVPAQFRVIVTRRPKYACRSCEEVVVQAPAAERLVEGGIPTEATVAHVLVSKYADHLPLYRQAQIYARQGVNLDRSTLADWVGKAAFLLRPIHERLFERLKASGKLFADETTAPVLDPGRGSTKTGQLFAYARDDRPWGGIDPPGVAYLYAPDRKAEQPLRHPSGLRRNPASRRLLRIPGVGRAQCREPGVLLGACRRRFYELAQSGPAPIATEALQRIAELYRIESEIRGRSPEERRTARQERSRPVIDTLQPWLREKLTLVSQKQARRSNPLPALALGRTWSLPRRRPCRDRLQRRRTLDQAIALNRKNALFAGSDGGGEHWATIASLVETAKLNGSTRTPTSPASSPASSQAIRKASSTTCCPGPMPPRRSRPWPENSGYRLTSGATLLSA
ncbi:transposase [Mesorhizobium sp. LSJC255A00]|nr:transposase [Mesorhizobium sp. LSJC255A00]